MKKISILISVILLLAFTTDNNEHFANVDKVSDIPFFVFSEPTSEYETVGKAMSFNEMVKMIADQKSSVRQKAEKMVKNAQKRVKDEKITDFDALIVQLENDKVLAIKFKSDISTKAKINNYDDDLPVYFFNEPDEEYTVVKQLKADYSLRAERSGMLFDKINSMVNRTLKKQDKGEIEKFDAIIISPDDLSEKLIIFKKQ